MPTEPRTTTEPTESRHPCFEERLRPHGLRVTQLSILAAPATGSIEGASTSIDAGSIFLMEPADPEVGRQRISEHLINRTNR